MRITNQTGQPILTVDDWFTHSAPAKGKSHWKDGRSAKECAKAWLITGQPMIPVELRQLLDSHEDTKGFKAEVAIPEYETKLDNYKGSGRKHDLIVVGESSGKRTLIAIETKVDETFGEIASEYATKSVANNPRSKVPDRVNHLTRFLFGSKEAGEIRYQLIHAVAATLIEARQQGAEQAVFVVHQFVSNKMKPLKVLENKADYVEFVEKLTGVKLLYFTDTLMGPIAIPGGENVTSNIPIYIGYANTPILPLSRLQRG